MSYMLDKLDFGKITIELEQDNTASIKFVTRGRGTVPLQEQSILRCASSGGEELVVKHVPTAEMTVDILSKPF